MDKKKKKLIFSLIVFIAIIILMIVGSTFAYFSATISSAENAVSFKAAEYKLSLVDDNSLMKSRIIPSAEKYVDMSINRLDENKPVIICGDLNVAHKEIDLKNPKSNKNNAGFTQEERNKMTELLGIGLIDTYRYIYPDKENVYTWWSYMANSRQKNIGWRIDYFLTSDRLKQNIKEAYIYDEVLGSDHCPVGIEIII